MTDKFFFPLSLVILVGMVWVATLRSETACPVGSVSAANTDYKTITVTGHQLNRFIVGDYATKNDCRTDQPYILAIAASTESFPPSPDVGPHFRLAPDIETAAADRNLRLVISARAAPQNGAKSFEISYFAGSAGRSDWQAFELSDTFENYTFLYRTPPLGANQGVDFVGIRPVIANGASGLEIDSFTLLNLSLMDAKERLEANAPFVD